MAEMRSSDLDITYLKSAKHFHVSSLFLQRAFARDLPALFRELKRADLTISLDTNDDPTDTWDDLLEPLLEFVDVLLPNEVEACRIAHKETLHEALDVLSERVKCVVVKRGALGATVRQGREQGSVEGILANPIDTIGAGDSFNAGFLYALLNGLEAEQCARAGNICGALSTLRAGGTEAFRDRELVRDFLGQYNFYPLYGPTEGRSMLATGKDMQ
jgi:sugar/nucleoside kinase (ribokinase family)